MAAFTQSRFFRLLSLFLLIAVVTGCRTYGGYGTEEELQEQIGEAVDEFEQNLARSEADLAVLQRAAGEQSDLSPLVERFQSNLEKHRELLASHRSIAQDLKGSSSYRNLHRGYGTITTEQRMMRDTYNRTVRHIRAEVTGEPVEAEPLPNESFYYVEPVYYSRLKNPQQITMKQALGQ